MTEDRGDSIAWLRRELICIVRDDADAIADMLFERLCKRLGGRELYIPAPDKGERDAQIRAAFNGRNLQEVMKQFGISKATVYRVCGK